MSQPNSLLPFFQDLKDPRDDRTQKHTVTLAKMTLTMLKRAVSANVVDQVPFTQGRMA